MILRCGVLAPKGAAVATVNAESPEALVAAIRQQEAERLDFAWSAIGRWAFRYPSKSVISVDYMAVIIVLPLDLCPSTL